VAKQLVIIGNGYFNNPAVSGLGLNTQNTGLQANSTSTSVGTVYFEPGSANSVIMGCYVSSIYVRTGNITIKRNMVPYGIYLSNYNFTTSQSFSWSNLDIRQNMIDVGVRTQGGYFTTNGGQYSITGVSIQNNIFYDQQNQTGIDLPVGISGFIQNNVLSHYYSGTVMNVYNFQINNNYIVQGLFNPNNNVYFNNAANGTQFGNANGNQQNVAPTSMFANFNGAGLTETRYTLAAGGPGVGTGFNGANIGIFGGPDPYKLSGIPPIPTIYSLSAPATTTTSTLQVTLSTRSND
jgi:hypothetical protein